MSDETEEKTKEETSLDASNLQSELESLLNRYSCENVSNTPDFILAGVMLEVLKVFECGIKRRDKWYDITLEPGKSTAIVRSITGS